MSIGIQVDGGSIDSKPIFSGDDCERDVATRKDDWNCGKAGELAFKRLLERNAVEYEYVAEEYEEDFRVNGNEIEIKTRKSTTGYRDLVVKEDAPEDSDIYVLCVAHYDITGVIQFVEFVGYARDKKLDREAEPFQFSGKENYRPKIILEEQELDDFESFVTILEVA